VVRRLCWDWQPVDDTTTAVDDFLREAGTRPWQRELAVPTLAEALTNSGEQTQNAPDTPSEG
jgi:ribonuclease D